MLRTILGGGLDDVVCCAGALITSYIKYIKKRILLRVLNTADFSGLRRMSEERIAKIISSREPGRGQRKLRKTSSGLAGNAAR